MQAAKEGAILPVRFWSWKEWKAAKMRTVVSGSYFPVKELVHTPLSTNSLISFNSTLLGNKPDIYGSKMVTLKETIIRGKSYTHPFTFNQQSLKNI